MAQNSNLRNIQIVFIAANVIFRVSSSKKNFIAQNSNLRNIQIVFIAANVIFRVFSSKKNFMPPFRFKCLKSTEPLQVSSSLFITQFREIPGTDFINLGRIKGWLNLGATRSPHGRFEDRTIGLGIKRLNQ